MDVQDFKRWHWIALAIFVGVILAYVWSSVEPTIPRSIGQQTFESALIKVVTDLKTGEKSPGLSRITVYPPQSGDRDNKKIYIVTGEQLFATADSKIYNYKPFSFKAETPYTTLGPGGRPTPGDPNETIVTYLKKMKEKYPHVSYTYAWWREPAATYGLWTAGSIIVIGGIWPTIISLLVGAGFGHAKKEKSDYDLERFKAEKEKPAVPVKTGPTEEQLDQLERVQAHLEENLAAGATASTVGAVGVAGEEPVKKLDGKTEAQTAIEQAKEDHEYRGEFYPVDRGVKKKE